MRLIADQILRRIEGEILAKEPHRQKHSLNRHKKRHRLGLETGFLAGHFRFGVGFFEKLVLSLDGFGVVFVVDGRGAALVNLAGNGSVSDFQGRTSCDMFGGSLPCRVAFESPLRALAAPRGSCPFPRLLRSERARRSVHFPSCKWRRRASGGVYERKNCPHDDVCIRDRELPDMRCGSF